MNEDRFRDKILISQRYRKDVEDTLQNLYDCLARHGESISNFSLANIRERISYCRWFLRNSYTITGDWR